MKIGQPDHPIDRDRGFTLVELLIVIVILGVLATVTVFAVRGITDKGDTNARATDLRLIERAEEAHQAQTGRYGTEAELVAAGLLRGESTLHDVDLVGEDYTVVAEGAAAEALNIAITTTFAGFQAERYGTGAKTLVVLGGPTLAHTQWSNWVAANPPIPDTQWIYITDPTMTTKVAVDAAIATGATAWVSAYTFWWNYTGTGQATPIWYLVNGLGIGNRVQWDDHTESMSVVANNFVATYG